MKEIITILLAAGILLPVLYGAKHLAGARWQFAAAIPLRFADGAWQCVNITFYGLIIALSTMVSLSVMIFLAGSAGAGLLPVLALGLAVIVVCMPAAGIIARVVEKRKNRFTVGGASFAGLLIVPWVAFGMEFICRDKGWGVMPAWPVMAAVSIAYVLGEGLGRLACISFGCCYGKPVAECSPRLAKWFEPSALCFTSATKKAVYEGGFSGVPLVPVQIITALWHSVLAITGFYLFLQGMFMTAFLITSIPAFAWRYVSEFLRADHRGGGKISAYQIMSLLSAFYSLLIVVIMPHHDRLMPDILSGWLMLWSPGTILFVLTAGFAALVHFGISRVTGSSVIFHALEQNFHNCNTVHKPL